MTSEGLLEKRDEVVRLVRTLACGGVEERRAQLESQQVRWISRVRGQTSFVYTA